MKKETYVYPSTGARMKAEYKIFIVAFVFIVIADSIDQIQVPLGPGTLILFPIFYSLIMGVLAGPEVLKIFNRKEVKAAAELPAGICVAFGLVTGALCALSGAGGPILVMPLLVVFGVPVKTAVGVALFNSIFIAIPSCIGYSLQCDPAEMAVLLGHRCVGGQQKHFLFKAEGAEKRCGGLFCIAGSL